MIKGDKVILKSLSSDDAAQVLVWENNPDVWRFSSRDTPFSLSDIKSFISSAKEVRKTKQLRLLVCDKNECRVGLVDLFDIDFSNHRAALGILIAETEYRKKGLATEALKLMMKFALNTYKISNFHCTIQADNQASIYLFEKLKFTRVGERKDWYKIDGKWINEYFYQRIID